MKVRKSAKIREGGNGLVAIAIVIAALTICKNGVLMAAEKDAMRGPALRDVRLEGWLGAKMDRFIARRLVEPFMRNQVFDEARQTYEFRDDDARLGDKFTWFSIWF